MDGDGESNVGFARANTFRDAIAAVVEPEAEPEAPVDADAAADPHADAAAGEGVVVEAEEAGVMADKIEKVKKARAKAKLLKKLKDDRRKQDREVEAEIQSERQKLARRISAENGSVAAAHGEVAGADTKWTRKLKHRDTLKQLKKDKSGGSINGPGLPLGPVDVVAEDGAEDEDEEEEYEDEEDEEAEKQAVSSTGLSLQSSDSDFDLKLNLLRRARSKAKLLRSQTERKELQTKIKLVERARAKARMLREQKEPEQPPAQAQEGAAPAQSQEGVAGGEESDDVVAALPTEEFEQRVNLLRRARSRAKLLKAEQEQKDLEHKIELLEKARSKAKLIKQASLSKIDAAPKPAPAPAPAEPQAEASAVPPSDHISPEELETRIQLLKKARTKAQLLRKEEEDRKDLEVKKGLVSKALAKGKLLKQASLSKAKMAPAPDAEDEAEPGDESTDGVSAAELNTRIKLLKKARARAKKMKAAEEEKELQLKITLLQKARSKAKLIKSQSQDSNVAAAGEQPPATQAGESADMNHKIALVRKARAKAKILKELEKERKQADAAVEHEVEEAEKENEVFHTSKHAFQANLLIEAETKKLMRGDILVSPKHAEVAAASAQVHRGSVLAASIAEVPESKEDEEDEKGEEEAVEEEEEQAGAGEEAGEGHETGGETGAEADPRVSQTGESNEVETGIAQASVEEKRAVVQAIRESEKGAKHAREADLKHKVALVRKARAQAKQLRVRKEIEAEVRSRDVRAAREHELAVQREHSLLHKYQPRSDPALEEALRAELEDEGDIDPEATDQFDESVPVEIDVVAYVSVRPSADSFMRPSQSAYSLAEELALEAMDISADDKRMHSDGDLGSLSQHLADEWKKQAEAFEWGVEGDDGFVVIDGDLAAMIPSEAYVLSDKQWAELKERERLLVAALAAEAAGPDSAPAPAPARPAEDAISESGRALSSVSLVSRHAPSPPPNSTYSGVSARSLDSPSSGHLVVPSPVSAGASAGRGSQWKEAVEQRATAMNSQQAEVDNLLSRISKVTKLPDPAGPKAGTDIPSNLPAVSTDDLHAESETSSARGAPKDSKVTPFGDLIAAAEADFAKESNEAPPLQNEIAPPPGAETEAQAAEEGGRLCSRKDGRGICQCVVM